MYLDNLKNNHRDIYTHIHSLQQYKTAAAVDAHAAELSTTLAKLAGLLSIHLAAEDNYLYPNLAKSENEQVRKTSIAFHQEMGGLAKEFMAYKDTFMTATKIKQDPAGFLAATDAAVGSLLKRLEHEDCDLYPLV